jgi:hypothetical protein
MSNFRRASILFAVMVAMLAAVFGAAGAAGAAQPGPGAARPGAALAVAVGGARSAAARSAAGRPAAGKKAAAAGEKECFYTIPDCASTDPTVEFGIASNGDTSGCTFSYTVDWGDKTSETKSFPGGADGSLLATFTHTYDKTKPDTYTIDVAGTTTQGSCTAESGTLQFTLTPQAGVAAVRFAPAGGRTLTTPGLPVIKDDGPSLTKDESWGPTDCNGVPDPRTFDYLDCGSPVPSGTPDKNWPVIFVAGKTLSIDEAVFAANGPVSSPQLTATATVGGSSLTLAATPLTSAKTSNGYLLTATGLSFTGALPAVPGRDKLSITWTVTETDVDAAIDAGTSTHTLYVTAADYAPPSGGGAGEVEQPYETLLDVGTVAAAGQSSPTAVFDEIWKKFETRTIDHPILDPATGEVSDGPAFDYYNNDYPQIADWFNKPFGSCPLFTKFLSDDSGHCGNWAEFLAGVLAFQGIPAAAAGLGSAPGFYSGPSPSPGYGPDGIAYMLVGPSLWSFGAKNGSGNYPYRDKLTVSGGKVAITGSNVAYHAPGGPQAQGPVSDPPMMFETGDHAIVALSLSGSGVLWVDPSYGNPQSITPYANIPDYEKTALAGFAVIYKKVGKNLVPVPYGADVASVCAGSTCYFQAARY